MLFMTESGRGTLQEMLTHIYENRKYEDLLLICILKSTLRDQDLMYARVALKETKEAHLILQITDFQIY